ncbi:uncharacterized protein LOC106653869 [Trichogramma pretiosum]|uniref:uncharacterized protein LOC106653869 n=1 Tax=Trichogramma pretiosum TaxID=7493 RepID=UPI0006C93CC4|nr:uncharacterized protein LOC106653869 [Trichogramma pretiosum]
MFTKILFLVVLGCAVVLARPDPKLDLDESEVQQAPSLRERISHWWTSVKTKAKNAIEKVKTGTVKLYDRLSGREASRAQALIAHLQDNLKKLDESYRQKLEAKAEEIDAIRESLRREKDDQISSLKNDHLRELTLKQSELDTIRREGQRRIEEVKKDYEGMYHELTQIVKARHEKISKKKYFKK